MSLNAETDAILKDLESSGFDLSSVRQQAQRNPVLENVANAKLGGALLRREEYTKYKEAKDAEINNLQKQVRELASAHDSVEGFKGNDALYNAALEKIAVLEENLITQGFDPEEVRNLSHNEKEGLRSAVSQAKTKDEGQPKVEERKVPDDKNYLDVEMFQTAAANLIGGNLISTVRIQRALQKADKLGIEITPELERKFEENLLSGAEKQKSFEQIADETFGFSAKEKEMREKQQNELIESKARELAAERLKEAGIPESAMRTRPKSIMDSYSGRLGADANAENAIKGEGGTVLVKGRQLPANKFGDPEYHKLRGDKSTRIQHAMQSMNELQEKRPEMFEDVY